MHTIKQRLYQTENRDRLVPDGDPEARFLYAVPGRRISDADAKRYGLIDTIQAEPTAGDEEEPKVITFGGEPDETTAQADQGDEAVEPKPDPAADEADLTPPAEPGQPVKSLIEPAEEAPTAKPKRRGLSGRKKGASS
jgi:hypothetical protein